MVLLQEAWVHDETIIEALIFLEWVRVNVINRNYKILPTFQANLFYVMFCIIALQRTTHQPCNVGVWYGGHFTPTNPWIYGSCPPV